MNEEESTSGGRSHRVSGEIVLVLIVTLIGGWLRFHALGRESLWFDEGISYLAARQPLRHLLRTVAVVDPHPPLYHLLLHGVLSVGDSETALRTPSAFFGTLSIPLLYLLGRALFSGSAGVLAALLLALSPPHVKASQDARMYALLTCEGILSWYLFSELLMAPRRSRWIGYLLASEAMIYTHYYGALLLLGQTAVVALLRYRGEVAPRFWSRLLAAQPVLVLLFLPWVGFAGSLFSFENVGWIQGVVGQTTPLQWARTIVDFFLGAHQRDRWRFGVGLPLLALVAASFVRSERRQWRSPREALRESPLLLCVAYFAVPIAALFTISQIRQLIVSRHLLMTAPALFLLVAVGLSRLLPERLLIGEAAVLTLILLPGLIHPRWPRLDLRGPSTLIAANAQPGDLVLFSLPSRYRVFEYYIRGRVLPLNACPQFLDDSFSFEIAEDPDRYRDCINEATRVWVVLIGRDGRQKFLAPLSERFAMTRVEDFSGARVALFARAAR